MFRAIANTFANCFKIPELKSRIIFTLLLLGICRIMAWITIPGLNAAELMKYFEQHAKELGGSVLGMYSLFTGGALQHCAVGSLGIMPYITATIIVQLLTAVVPQLSKLAREEGGRGKLIQYGRCLTVVLCLGHGTLMALTWEHPEKLPKFTGQLVLVENLWWYRIQTVLILTTGTLLLMWLGEQITERGIGNGVSLVITIGIVADLPSAVQAAYVMFTPHAGIERQFNLFHGVALGFLSLAVVAGVVAGTQAPRENPVQYAQRMVGGKGYAGQSPFIAPGGH